MLYIRKGVRTGVRKGVRTGVRKAYGPFSAVALRAEACAQPQLGAMFVAHSELMSTPKSAPGLRRLRAEAP